MDSFPQVTNLTISRRGLNLLVKEGGKERRLIIYQVKICPASFFPFFVQLSKWIEDKDITSETESESATNLPPTEPWWLLKTKGTTLPV